MNEMEMRAWNKYLNSLSEGDERIKWPDLDERTRHHFMAEVESEYRPYQHVERLGRGQTAGILDGTVYVFPKIDGTNAHAWKCKDEFHHYGSRNRELTLDKDNAGFMRWAMECKELDDLLNIIGDFHVFGEWLVPHTLKTYREDAWRRFYIFDIVNIVSGEHLKYEDVKALCDEVGYTDYIAPLRILINPSPDDVIKVQDENDYLIKDGEGLGEGIVCKNYEYKNKYGRVTWAKIVSSEFKGQHRRDMGAPISKCADMVEPQIVDDFLTCAMIDKVEAKILVSLDDDGQEEGFTGRHIPKLLGMVWYDFITEELFDALKKFKNPKIDFKYLNRLVTAKIKELREDLF